MGVFHRIDEFQVRYEYVENSLKETDEVIFELLKFKEHWIIEQEICNKIKDKENELQAKLKLKEIDKAIDVTKKRYDVLLEMWKEMLREKVVND